MAEDIKDPSPYRIVIYGRHSGKTDQLAKSIVDLISHGSAIKARIADISVETNYARDIVPNALVEDYYRGIAIFCSSVAVTKQGTNHYCRLRQNHNGRHECVGCNLKW